jgi:hypothetical protein
MTKLVFSRQFNEARGETHVYRVYRDGHPSSRLWSLTIFIPDRFGTLLGEDARIIADGDLHDGKRLAVSVAQAYEDLGDNYSQADRGGKARLTQATLDAYAADKAA